MTERNRLHDVPVGSLRLLDLPQKFYDEYVISGKWIHLYASRNDLGRNIEETYRNDLGTTI